VPGCTSEDEGGVNGTLLALTVVGLQIAPIGRRLVDVGPVGKGLALQLEDEHAAVCEKDDVRPAELERELVLEDDGVVAGRSIQLEDLADLTLKRRDRLVPRMHLRESDLPEERLERAAN
jgi:hypothetical protein